MIEQKLQSYVQPRDVSTMSIGSAEKCIAGSRRAPRVSAMRSSASSRLLNVARRTVANPLASLMESPGVSGTLSGSGLRSRWRMRSRNVMIPFATNDEVDTGGRLLRMPSGARLGS